MMYSILSDEERLRAERRLRPDWFKDCLHCGAPDVRVGANYRKDLNHICDPEDVRRLQESQRPRREPNPDRVRYIEDVMLAVLERRNVGIEKSLLRELAEELSYATGGRAREGAGTDTGR